MGITIVCGEAALADIRTQSLPGVEVVPVDAYAPGGPAVVWLDGLSADEVAALSGKLATAKPRPIAVLGAKWDGFEPVPLAAHCRGVISGFGLGGLNAAIETLARDGDDGGADEGQG